MMLAFPDYSHQDHYSLHKIPSLDFSKLCFQSSQPPLAERLQVLSAALPWENYCSMQLRGIWEQLQSRCHGLPPFLPRFSRFSWINASQSFTWLWSTSGFLKLQFFTTIPTLPLPFGERTCRALFSAIPKVPSHLFLLEDPYNTFTYVSLARI